MYLYVCPGDTHLFTLSDDDNTSISVISGRLIELHTVKHVFKGPSDERTPCDQGMCSQNYVLSPYK